MSDTFLSHISDTLTQIQAEGLYKHERMITSPQSGEITVGGKQVINLCANNYLGLSRPTLDDRDQELTRAQAPAGRLGAPAGGSTIGTTIPPVPRDDRWA